MDKLFTTIGKRIAQKRQELCFSQEELAALAGVHRNYLGCVERAEKRVTLATLYKITKALDITMEELFKGL